MTRFLQEQFKEQKESINTLENIFKNNRFRSREASENSK
jgi:hypothetical protein